MVQWNKLARITHDCSEKLRLTNKIYLQFVRSFLENENKMDLMGLGDVTSRLVVPKDERIRAKIFSQEDGVLAGVQELNYFLFDSFRNFHGAFVKLDGDSVLKGDEILWLEGNAREILEFERLSLNFLQRMSGVATLTKKMVDSLGKNEEGVLLAPTRKTLWGLLDKRAVTVGGGGTHRFGLYDAVLIKDTHLRLNNYSFDQLEKRILEKDFKGRFLEVEAEDEDSALKAVGMFRALDLQCPVVLMFDNMLPQQITSLISIIKRDELRFPLLYEASGGIDLKNINSYAKSGVDVISSGMMTMSAPALSFHLKVQ